MRDKGQGIRDKENQMTSPKKPMRDKGKPEKEPMRDKEKPEC